MYLIYNLFGHRECMMDFPNELRNFVYVILRILCVLRALLN